MDRSSSATHDLSLPVAGDRPSARTSTLGAMSRQLSHPRSAGILPTSALCPPPSSSPFLQLARQARPSRRACAKVAPLWWYGRARLPHFHSYPPRPFARAHARPRSSPDWMALCQPATAIALICSSSPRCPSPCVYTSVPLSSLGSTHSQF